MEMRSRSAREALVRTKWGVLPTWVVPSTVEFLNSKFRWDDMNLLRRFRGLRLRGKPRHPSMIDDSTVVKRDRPLEEAVDTGHLPGSQAAKGSAGYSSMPEAGPH